VVPPLDVIQKACIITRFTLPWKRDTYRPLDVSLSLNGQPIGYLSEVVPEGHYVFQINPSILNFASSGIATNTITLATTHQNGGHYTVVSDITVMIVYQGINLSVVASTQEEANALVNNMTQTLLANWPNPSVFAEDIKANATVREGIQILNITLWNLGAAYANYVPLSICDGNTTIAHILAFIPPFQNVTIPIEWKATAGYHAIQAIVDPQNLQNRLDNENNQAQISITVLALNVAIANATYTKNVVGQGFSFSVSVTAANRGDFTETFNVTVYANTTIIASQNVTLSAGDSTLVTFTCNTTVFALGNYTISAYAWPVLGETNIQDNNFTAGTVRVGIPGDVDPADGYVGIDDIFNIATHFAQEPNHPNWNPIYDLNNDLYVGIDDIFTAAQHFGQEDP
jgi:hypothetical protein